MPRNACFLRLLYMVGGRRSVQIVLWLPRIVGGKHLKNEEGIPLFDMKAITMEEGDVFAFVMAAGEEIRHMVVGEGNVPNDEGSMVEFFTFDLALK